MLRVGPLLVNRSVGRDQVQCDPKDPHQSYKKDQVYPDWNTVTETYPWIHACPQASTRWTDNPVGLSLRGHHVQDEG